MDASPKFHWNQSIGFREEDIWRVFTIYGHGGHLGHVTYIINIYIGQAVSEKKIFEIVDGRRTDGRTDAGSWPSYKLTLLNYFVVREQKEIKRQLEELKSKPQKPQLTIEGSAIEVTYILGV